MFHIPTNDSDLATLTQRMNNGRHKYFNDAVGEKKLKKLRDATCLFFGFPEGYQQLKSYWENNPKCSLGAEAYVLISDNDILYFNKNEFSTSASGKDRHFQMHKIHPNKTPRHINFSDDIKSIIANDYYFENVYFKLKDGEDYILDTSLKNIYQTLFITEKLKGMNNYLPNTNIYKNEYTSNIKFDYFSKTPNITKEYDGKLTNQMLVRIIRKNGYLLTVLEEKERYEYEVFFKDRSELYQHLDNMHIGKSKIIINKI